MTLDEAIDHCLERANQDCSACAKKHQQLADWLTELKCRREKLSVDKLDEFTVMPAEAFAKDEYHKGYEQGKKDAVKHGYWIFENELVCDIKCSACDSTVFWMNAKRPKFCPNCGAKMDGKAY